MTRIRQMTAAQVERILKRYGFELISQKGSHRKWRNQASNLQVTVPYHKGKTVPVGTLRNIMVSANIPEMEWKAQQSRFHSSRISSLAKCSYTRRWMKR